jgi:hypothetical protein
MSLQLICSSWVAGVVAVGMPAAVVQEVAL